MIKSWCTRPPGAEVVQVQRRIAELQRCRGGVEVLRLSKDDCTDDFKGARCRGAELQSCRVAEVLSRS